MAYSSNPGYDDMEPPSHEEPHAEGKEDESEHKGEEYPLPIGVLAGKADEFNVGDEVVLRITAKHPDQIFVTYAPAKEQEEGKGKEGMAEEASEGGEGGGGLGKEMSSMYE